jgi:hypothetical protein
MPVAERYRRQAALLIQVMPFVAAEQEFALKGGTAINLFVRDMPRISVDLDLTYLPVADRKTSLKAIDAAMKRIANAITAGMRGARIDASRPKGETCITRLDVRAQACGLLPVVRHTGRISPRPSCRGVRAIVRFHRTTNVVGSIGLPPTRASRTILEHL